MSPREKLLEAAIACLQERGYAHTTTRDLVAAAGLHLPAVNYYFGSKERLLHEAVVEALRRWAATTMADSEGAEGSPRERLHRSIARFLDTLQADRPYVVAAAEAFAQAERSDELRGRLAAAYADFRSEVAWTLQAATGPSADEPPPEAVNLASVLIALFDGLAVQWLLDPQEAPDAGQVTSALDLLVTVLAG